MAEMSVPTPAAPSTRDWHAAVVLRLLDVPQPAHSAHQKVQDEQPCVWRIHVVPFGSTNPQRSCAESLAKQHASELRAAPLSYAPRESAEADAPPGYNRMDRSVLLARRDFYDAGRDLFAWRMHSRAGLHVQASDIPSSGCERR